MAQRKKAKKLADLIKECKIAEPDRATELGSVANKVADPNLVSQWPKLSMKVPPLFLHKPEDLEKIAVKLVAMGINFFRPSRGSFYTKISFPSYADHRAMALYFDKNNMPYHTYGHPTKRKMKVMIRGLPKETDLNSVKLELKQLSIPVVRVHKLHTKEGNNRPLVVMAVVPHSDEGKVILQVRKILGHDVKLEPPKVKASQCHRCQKWGHSQRYCHAEIRCVKCAGNHFTKKCTRNRDESPPKCANCGLAHPANFRGCSHCPESEVHKLTLKRKLARVPIRNKIPEVVTKEMVANNKLFHNTYSSIDPIHCFADDDDEYVEYEDGVDMEKQLRFLMSQM